MRGEKLHPKDNRRNKVDCKIGKVRLRSKCGKWKKKSKSFNNRKRNSRMKILPINKNKSISLPSSKREQSNLALCPIRPKMKWA